jgi:SseB protein N-terminal domain
VRSLNAAGSQFAGDDGAADPAVLAALTAYAAGQGSEHAALNALASSRLLVPVVAVLTEESSGDTKAAEDSETEGTGAAPGHGLRREKSTEMALPTLIGQDGRAAILAFTSLDALTRWRPDARPVAVPAARAWQAGAGEASAVVIDVAGPVPVTVEGARLAALAAGRPAPLPHQDPDVLAALHAALGDEPLIVQASLTTPDQRAGWEYGPRPEDLPDLAARSAADLSMLGLDLPGPGRPEQSRPEQNGAGPHGGHQDSAAGDGTPGASAASDGTPGTSASETSAADAGAGAGSGGGDTADLALLVTLADGCDPAAATAAVRRVAEALLTATGGRLRRGMEVSVAPARAR